MDLATELRKALIDSLKETLPALTKKNAPQIANQLKTTDLVDRSSSALGFSKITRKGYTP